MWRWYSVHRRTQSNYSVEGDSIGFGFPGYREHFSQSNNLTENHSALTTLNAYQNFWKERYVLWIVVGTQDFTHSGIAPATR